MNAQACRKVFILSIVCVLLWNPTQLVFSETGLDSYKIQKFWDKSVGCVFHYQVQMNACAPASVQMVLNFFDVSPLPNQEELAAEMNTTVYEYAYTDHLSVPFKNRNITVIFAGHLLNSFSEASRQLKQNISLKSSSDCFDVV